MRTTSLYDAFQRPPQKRDAANRPQSAVYWGQIKMFSGSKIMYLFVFPRLPRQKRPWSCHYAFCGGPFATCVFTVFPRHPRQERPWSCHYAFCGWVLSPPVFLSASAAPPPEAALEPPLWILCGGPLAHDAGVRTANLMGPCGSPPRPGPTGGLYSPSSRRAFQLVTSFVTNLHDGNLRMCSLSCSTS